MSSHPTKSWLNASVRLAGMRMPKPYFVKAYASLTQIDWLAEDTARLERLKELAGS